MAGLYLHIPFCDHKCIYCDFYSIENLSRMQSFVDALGREIELYGRYGQEEVFETVFFGGGTPSLLSPEQLGKILSQLRSTFSIAPDAEVTVETNPGTVDAGKLAAFRALGVNRLSVGIQSFWDDDLRFLTRIHSADEARRCVLDARRTGFANINIDLIFSLPNQTPPRWRFNLGQALELEPTHISAYSLIIEHGTPLSRMAEAGRVKSLPVGEDAELFEMTMETLEEAGYEHYEVSNYARTGYRSRHNSNYWNHTRYLGFGPSAHSFWNSDSLRARRWWNIANLRTYLEKAARSIAPVAGEEELSGAELLDEAVMLGLRSRGIDLGRLRERFGVDLRVGGHVVNDLLDQRLATIDRDHLRLTRKGFLLCDEISKEILARLDRAPVAA